MISAIGGLFLPNIAFLYAKHQEGREKVRAKRLLLKLQIVRMLNSL